MLTDPQEKMTDPKRKSVDAGMTIDKPKLKKTKEPNMEETPLEKLKRLEDGENIISVL